MKRIFCSLFLTLLVCGFLQCTLADKLFECNRKSFVACFFEEFMKAYNSNDVEKVVKMSGTTSRSWLQALDNNDKIEKIEIENCTLGSTTNVSTRITSISALGKKFSFNVDFSLFETNGEYCIEKMSVPAAENWNKQFNKSRETSEKLIQAINNHDVDQLKKLIYGDVGNDWEKEFSDRGLSWIAEAINDEVKIKKRRMLIQCVHGNEIEGRVPVFCRQEGSNVTRRVIFKDGKIYHGKLPEKQ